MPCSSNLLIILNSITAVLGLGVVGGAIYFLVDFGDWNQYFGTGSLYVAIAAGVLMTLISVLGCFGAINKKGSLLCGYVILLLLVAILTGVGIFLFLVAIGNLDVTANAVGATLTEESQIVLNNAILSTYTTCCSGCTGEGCENLNPQNGCTASTCAQVEYCSDLPANNELACYISESENNPAPPITISDTICTALTRFSAVDADLTDIEGATIVGNIEQNANSCGAGDPTQFRTDVNNWFKGNTGWIIGLVAGFGVLIILTLGSAVVTMCQLRSD